MATTIERAAPACRIVTVPDSFDVADYLVDRHVREGRGGRTAILCGDESVTYAEIADRSNRLANGLRSLSVRREERVLLLLLDTPAFAYSFFGAQKIGAVPIPTNTLLKSQDYRYMLNDSRATAAIVSEALLPQLTAIPRAELPYLKNVVVDGAATSSDLIGLDHLLSATAQIERFKPTLFFSVPTNYGQLLAHKREAGDFDLSSIRHAVSAGEALPRALYERFKDRFGVEILDGIGSTEILHIFIANRPGRIRPGSSGELVPGYEARIVDEAGSDVPGGTG